MTFQFKKQIREDTPLIIGLAGPTKSGKTFSAHRLARGLAQGGIVAMLNAEGKRGHQYADRFDYMAADIHPPYSPRRYTEALNEVRKIRPAVLIIDSLSHMHDGPGGMLEEHDEVLDKLAGDRTGKERDAYNWAAWARVKKPENEFVYTMQDLDIPIIACFRAKEKLRIVRGKPPEDLGWQPISSDRVAFETIFTLILPPHCKGVPDLDNSDMREPFDSIVPKGVPLDEALGLKLAEWSKGRRDVPATAGAAAGAPPAQPGGPSEPLLSADQVTDLGDRLRSAAIDPAKLLAKVGVDTLAKMPASKYQSSLAWIEAVLDARRAKGTQP